MEALEALFSEKRKIILGIEFGARGSVRQLFAGQGKEEEGKER